jgi:hypothetical protein
MDIILLTMIKGKQWCDPYANWGKNRVHVARTLCHMRALACSAAACGPSPLVYFGTRNMFITL